MGGGSVFSINAGEFLVVTEKIAVMTCTPALHGRPEAKSHGLGLFLASPTHVSSSCCCICWFELLGILLIEWPLIILLCATEFVSKPNVARCRDIDPAKTKLLLLVNISYPFFVLGGRVPCRFSGQYKEHLSTEKPLGLASFWRLQGSGVDFDGRGVVCY